MQLKFTGRAVVLGMLSAALAFTTLFTPQTSARHADPQGQLSRAATQYYGDPPPPPPPPPTATPVPLRADLAVFKGKSSAFVLPNQSFTMTTYVRNVSGNTATSVRVNKVLGTGLTLVSATPGQGTYSSGVWNVGTLAPGAGATLTLSVRAPSTANVRVANTSTISSAITDPNSANNRVVLSFTTRPPSSTTIASATTTCTRNPVNKFHSQDITVEFRTGWWLWASSTRRTIANASIQWLNLCYSSTGRLLNAPQGNFAVNVQPQSEWTRVSQTASRCVPTNTATDNRWCAVDVVLRAPYSGTASVTTSIDLNAGVVGVFRNALGTAGAQVNANYSWNSTTREQTYTLSMGVGANGCMWATGTGSTGQTCNTF